MFLVSCSGEKIKFVDSNGSLVGEAFRMSGGEYQIAPEAIEQVKPTFCKKGSDCGFVTKKEIEKILKQFTIDHDKKNNMNQVFTAFGGCPRGSTGSVCINQTQMLCVGSMELGDAIISCSTGICKGSFPSATCT